MEGVAGEYNFLFFLNNLKWHLQISDHHSVPIISLIFIFHLLLGVVDVLAFLVE